MRSDHTHSRLDWRHTPCQLAARWPINLPLMWLHSGRVHPRWARWSIMATPRAIYRFDGCSHLAGCLTPSLTNVSFTHDPLVDLDAIITATSLDPHAHDGSDLPFRGGWIGCFSYDLGRLIEPRAQHPSSSRHAEVNWPLIELAWCPDALIFDHLKKHWHRVSTFADAHSAEELLTSGHALDFELGELKACLSPSAYEGMVERTIELIAAGDIFQANIAQRFIAPIDGSTRGLAMQAFEHAQPWYGAYMECTIDRAHTTHSRTLLSLSPELFLQFSPATQCITTRPIKGTRPSTCDALELLHSIKDQAELNMIVDLMRNDLGRICEVGSMRVAQPRIIESHPTVHHGVAEIAGRLRHNMRISDVVRATFPPGSVTGAPKIRAMQIIDQLEAPRLRGPYCGAIGYISDCGAMTLNVAIRTMLIAGRHEHPRCDRVRDGVISYSAGAGIVADSIPAREQQETLDKAAVLRTLSQAFEPMVKARRFTRFAAAAASRVSARAADARCICRSGRRRISDARD